MIRPKPLLPGGTIGVFAPSSRVDKDSIERAVQWLENYSFQVVIHPQTYAEYNQSAGTAEEKIAALKDLWEDPQVGAIMAARGGNRSSMMLPGLTSIDFTKSPKPIIGYSDMTALLNAITTSTDLVTFHGPALSSFVNDTDEKHLEMAFHMMAGNSVKIPTWGGSVRISGEAEGKLVGGNMSLICSMLATPWEPDFDGAILFLEDTGDQMSRYDRMLIQLKNAGVFTRVAAVIFGQTVAADDHSRVPFTLNFDELIAEHVMPFNKPLIANMPFGHGRDLTTLPVGMTARIEAEGDYAISFNLAETPVA